MTEAEIIQRYNIDKPALKYFSKNVNKVILAELKKLKKKPDNFLKIKPIPRLKDDDSLISKALYRNKNYSDPYQDITDKVGLRYVVLLTSEIKIISNIIETNKKWSYSLDKDFEREREEHPLFFDYQSVHYVIRNKQKIKVNGDKIPVGLPCEVQIRTLLQHAYSELTHDLTYKPKYFTTKKVNRPIARSMALIETTDSIFLEVNNKLTEYNKEMKKHFENILNLFKEIIHTEFEPKLNTIILDRFKDYLALISDNEINKFFQENKEQLFQIIKNKSQYSLLHRQPVILLLYYMISHKKFECKRLWPFTQEELKPLFSDLGVSFERED